jgi:DNA ligase-associated metallophosphoesterase
MDIILSGRHFLLLPQRAIFWQENSTLIFSDTHFGKATHFRKEGIPVPDKLFNTDLATLDKLVKQYTPQSLIIVGDMFHSHHNKEIELFATWRKDHAAIEIHLVKGNHDILPAVKYFDLDIQVTGLYTRENFAFAHDPCTVSDLFCFSGHIHPGVRISGMARQNLSFPCFHFTSSHCTLPAFSRFTGLSIVHPADGDTVYAIVENEVIAILR